MKNKILILPMATLIYSVFYDIVTLTTLVPSPFNLVSGRTNTKREIIRKASLVQITTHIPLKYNSLLIRQGYFCCIYLKLNTIITASNEIAFMILGLKTNCLHVCVHFRVVILSNTCTSEICSWKRDCGISGNHRFVIVSQYAIQKLRYVNVRLNTLA